MILYIILVLLLITIDETKTESNPDLIVSKAGIDTTSPCSVGIIFFVTLNNTSSENGYDIELTPDRCCLGEDFADCDVLQIVGGCRGFIPFSTAKTFKLVAPILDPFEREGYCEVYLDSNLNKQTNKRDIVKITFDTSMQSNDDTIKIKRCSQTDEDPLNDCKPVNCETYYNGRKTFYDRNLKRCVEPPVCITNDDDYPELIYNPMSNKCEKISLTEDDINILKKNTNNRKTKDIIMIRKFPYNDTEMNFMDPMDLEQTSRKSDDTSKIKELRNLKQIEKIKTKCLKMLILTYLRNNKWTIMVLGLVILFQCVLICSMIYCLMKTCDCFNDKKVVRKFFNYRHDVSVTTPLIGTSNMDTETTDCHYLSESSGNKDKNIKCYKSCQKESPEAIKQSMSDDIFTKYLNRRDWKIRHKSEEDPEINDVLDELERIKEIGNQKTYNFVVPQVPSKESKKSIETRVVFEDEKSNTSTYDVDKPKAVTIISNVENKDMKKDSGLVDSKSEKELKCHSYNCIDANITSLNHKKSGIFRSYKSRKETASTEKGAQAYFSNDSIEGFLSERGVICSANDNISKYTFSANSNDVRPIGSSTSSKTSKNLIKNVLSLLHMRSRQGPLSDPGNSKNLDVELLHMSRASVYSSSNESECVNNLKKGDSRTSF